MTGYNLELLATARQQRSLKGVPVAEMELVMEEDVNTMLEGDCPTGSVCELTVLGTKEGWDLASCGEFETAELFHGSRSSKWRCDPRGRLNRSQGCVSISTNLEEPPSVAEVRVEGAILRVCVFPLQAMQCSQGL